MTAVPAWHPVALSADIDPGTSNGTRLLGREIVVWRDASGTAHVWDDRCPHRGMRLSFGFVRGDHIACLYHGWQYDAGGQCRHIPAHPELVPPETVRVPVLDAIERLGMIWACDSEMAAAHPPPGERAVQPVRSITVERAAGVATARLLYDAGPPREDGRSGDWSVGAPAPALVVLGSDDHAIFLGVQPLSSGACALHAAIAGPGDERARVSHWLEEFRRSIEAEPAS